jgi:hypothetical protein
LHGKKDGEIIVRNEQPTLIEGKHEIIDTAHKANEGKFKETVEGEVS